MDGIETLRRLRAEFPAARVLMLTSSKAVEDMALALQSGAAGYVLKTIGHVELAAAIRAVHRGETVTAPLSPLPEKKVGRAAVAAGAGGAGPDPPGLQQRRDGDRTSPRRAARRWAAHAFLLVVTAAGGTLLRADSARAQDELFYGGGTRTWSNTLSWWQDYQATLQALAVPGANDTVIFKTSGSNGAGTVVFTDDATVAGLRVLSTATGGLTLRADGGDRTFTGMLTVQSTGYGVMTDMHR
jgi:CheY-like chemotaxis protein